MEPYIREHVDDIDENNKHRSRNFGVVVPIKDENTITEISEALNNLNLQYAYAQEEQSDKGFKHIQAFLHFKHQRQLGALKSIFGGSVIIICKTPERYLDYVRKEATRVIDGWIFETGKQPLWNTRSTTFSTFKDLIDCTSKEDAIEIAKGDPKAFVIQHKSIMSFINDKFTVVNKPKYGPNDFNIPLCDFPEGVYALLFVGKSGIGKTQFANAHFKNPVTIGVKDDYKKLTDDVDGFILDDVATKDWHATTLIRWLDGDSDHTMDVKYSSAVLPMHLRRIICLNSEIDFWPKELGWSFDPNCDAINDPKYMAIARRIVIHDFGCKDIRKAPKTVFDGKIKRIKY